MTPRELFLPNFTPLAIADVERAKVLFLAQFAHVGCGGAPVAYLRSSEIGCSCCHAAYPGQGPLGLALERSKAFVSLVVENA